MLPRKNLHLETRAILLESKDRAFVLDVTQSSGKVFKLVAVYVPSGTGQSEFFRGLKKFLGTSHSNGR